MIMSKGRKAYQIVINIILVLVALLMVLPLVLLFMSSITDENTLVVNGYSFFPAKFSLGAYQYIMQNSATIFRAYGITIIVTVVGTAGSLILASLMAFPLSLRDLPGRSILSFYVFFTMLFSGGLVPSYIMWTTTFHIKNTIWAYILPNFLLGAFNIILVRTFFSTSIPNDIYEAAKIDGAGYPTIYWKIVLPLGKPILVTIGLFAVFVLCSWAVSTLADGEGKFREIWIFTAYALLPYVISLAVLTGLSNAFSLEESAFLGIVQAVAYVWTGANLFMAIREVHQYTAGKTIAVTLVSLLGMYLVMLIVTIGYSMFTQLISFIGMIINELRLR